MVIKLVLLHGPQGRDVEEPKASEAGRRISRLQSVDSVQRANEGAAPYEVEQA